MGEEENGEQLLGAWRGPWEADAKLPGTERLAGAEAEGLEEVAGMWETAAKVREVSGSGPWGPQWQVPDHVARHVSE